jgi:hypothetical protein
VGPNSHKASAWAGTSVAVNPNNNTIRIPILPEQGGLAEVEKAVGRIRLKAGLTVGIQPDTIHIPQGWEETNANELTGAETPDPVSEFPNWESNRCRIRKINAPRE